MSAFESSAAAILGNGVVVQGEIHSKEPLIIEGEVDGSIHMPDHRLIIAEKGRVRAHASAQEIELQGWFEGQAEAKQQMRIGRSAEFVGDIRSGSIVIEDGAFLKAKVELSGQPGDKTK